jgi:SAM-dependent methyltransferase
MGHRIGLREWRTLARPKILSVLKRLQRWIQDKSGIGENRDALAVLRRRVDALAALQQQHLPETLSLPWIPELPEGVSPAIHRADAMFRFPLSVSGGDWVRAASEYFGAGRELALAAKKSAPLAQSLLDFGGGYGRVGRFLAAEFPTAERWVYDPKAGAMAFQQAAWGARPWNGTPVDLVVAGSVLTHLRPRDAAAELQRMLDALRPNGLALITLHDATPETQVHSATEESALPELEDQLNPENYASVYFSAADWNRLVPAGWTYRVLPERFGGTQQILVVTRAEGEA